MRKKVLILGYTGKMGLALSQAFAKSYAVTGKNSSDFDAQDFGSVRKVVSEDKYDIVINTVAFLGIDPCEKEPEKASRLNSLYPKLLAELSNNYNFVLIHFSTDAVFDDSKNDFYTEIDVPNPLNTYGATKWQGDNFIQSIAKRYYIFRLPLLFGRANRSTQFVEKMLIAASSGKKVLKISHDIVSSPTYSSDAAAEVKRITDEGYPYGLYHIANAGKASLCELMREIVKALRMDVEVEAASFRDFPHVGVKNTNTPIRSGKVAPLRRWEDSVKEYCESIRPQIFRK